MADGDTDLLSFLPTYSGLCLLFFQDNERPPIFIEYHRHGERLVADSSYAGAQLATPQILKNTGAAHGDPH